MQRQINIDTVRRILDGTFKENGAETQAQAALDRLKKGRYGECETCGGEIGETRLAAVPWATGCVRCEGVRERFEADRNAPSTGAPRNWLAGVLDAA